MIVEEDHVLGTPARSGLRCPVNKNHGCSICQRRAESVSLFFDFYIGPRLLLSPSYPILGLSTIAGGCFRR